MQQGQAYRDVFPDAGAARGRLRKPQPMQDCAGIHKTTDPELFLARCAPPAVPGVVANGTVAWSRLDDKAAAEAWLANLLAGLATGPITRLQFLASTAAIRAVDVTNPNNRFLSPTWQEDWLKHLNSRPQVDDAGAPGAGGNLADVDAQLRALSLQRGGAGTSSGLHGDTPAATPDKPARSAAEDTMEVEEETTPAAATADTAMEGSGGALGLKYGSVTPSESPASNNEGRHEEHHDDHHEDHGEDVKDDNADVSEDDDEDEEVPHLPGANQHYDPIKATLDAFDVEAQKVRLTQTGAVAGAFGGIPGLVTLLEDCDVAPGPPPDGYENEWSGPLDPFPPGPYH